MCTGLEVPLIATGVATVGKIAMDAIAGDATSRMQEAQAQIALDNQRQAEEQEMLTRRRTEVKVAKVKEAGQKLIGQQEVALASNNLDVSTGSAGDILEGTAGVVGEEVATVRYNGIAEAYGYHVAGTQFSAQAAAHAQAAEDAELAKWLAMAGDVLTGGATMAGITYRHAGGRGWGG